jgi:predicted TPR repeat methyltransferase
MSERPQSWNIKSSYQSRPRPEYYNDEALGKTDTTMLWQPEMYQLAARAAQVIGATSLVDIGCGCAGKLVALHPAFKVTGVDFGPNMAFCREHYPFGQWIEADFETTTQLTLPDTDLANSVIICSDVIEHLINPDALLALIASLLEKAPLAVISTPERILTWGVFHKGPPPNACHVREWSLGELAGLLQAKGFDVVKAGLTLSHSQSSEKMTSFIALAGKTLSAESRADLDKVLPGSGSKLDYVRQAWRRTLRAFRQPNKH